MKAMHDSKKGLLRVACFLSGTGSTARALIENSQKNRDAGYRVVCLFSDTSDKSKCSIHDIAQEYKIPYKINDIRAFYRNRNKTNTKDMSIRKEFDEQTSQWLEQNNVDVIALAGYMSIVTEPIFNKFVTINSHPADLCIKDESGKRKYTGAHAVLDCIKEGASEVRTSIILVNAGIDAGPIIVRSVKVQVPDTNGKTEDEIKIIAENIQNELKKKGDIPAYCAAIELIASGRVEYDEKQIFIDGINTPDGIELTAEKEQIRKNLLSARMRLSVHEVRERSEKAQNILLGMQVVQKARKIMAYNSMKNEVLTDKIISPNSYDSAKEIFVPKVINDTQMVAIQNENALVQEKIENMDVIIVPGIVFDKKGYRIGYGKGYYDRLLAKTKTTKIGLAFDFQVLDSLPIKEHDIPMNFVVTETRVIQC